MNVNENRLDQLYDAIVEAFGLQSREPPEVYDCSDIYASNLYHVWEFSFLGVTGIGMDKSKDLAALKAISEWIERKLLLQHPFTHFLYGSAYDQDANIAVARSLSELQLRSSLLSTLLLNDPIQKMSIEPSHAQSQILLDKGLSLNAFQLKDGSVFIEVFDVNGCIGNGFSEETDHAFQEALRRYLVFSSLKPPVKLSSIAEPFQTKSDSTGFVYPLASLPCIDLVPFAAGFVAVSSDLTTQNYFNKENVPAHLDNIALKRVRECLHGTV